MRLLASLPPLPSGDIYCPELVKLVKLSLNRYLEVTRIRVMEIEPHDGKTDEVRKLKAQLKTKDDIIGKMIKKTVQKVTEEITKEKDEAVQKVTKKKDKEMAETIRAIKQEGIAAGLLRIGRTKCFSLCVQLSLIYDLFPVSDSFREDYENITFWLRRK